MECKNKTKYIKNLDIVRKCHCTKKCYWLLDATTQQNIIINNIISSNSNETNEEKSILNGKKNNENMDDLYMMMMGDDPLVYHSPPVTDPTELEGRSGDVITNSTNQMLDVVNDKRQRKGNRRQNNQRRNRHRNNNNNNNQNDGTSFDDNNPINVISAFNRTNKIYNKLRKNDAVKVIDTPSGRAGFVYQSSSSNNNNNNQDFPMSPSVKESNTNWEDSYSQNQFVNRNANDVKMLPGDDTSNKKIMPVLTSDGKIALVVRGDTSRYYDENQNNGSGNSVSSKRYEPITNLTSIITALNSNNDNNINKQNDSINLGDDQTKSLQEQNRLINRLDEFFASVTNKVKHIEEVVEHELGIDVEDTDEDDDVEMSETTMKSTSTTTTEASYDADDHKKNLLQINRPLSEVLGLPKKTHYHHPQDPLHTTPETTHVTRVTESRRINTAHKTSTQIESVLTTTDVMQPEEFDHESPEVINIAVIPGFDSEMEERLFGKDKDNLNRNLNEVSETSGAISSIHCAMQAMVAIACACTVFGVLGAYYRIEIVHQVRGVYWWLVVPFTGQRAPTTSL